MLYARSRHLHPRKVTLRLTLQIWGVLAWIRGLETKTVNHGTIDAVGWKAAKVRPADDPSTALQEIMTRKKYHERLSA